ncbi:unnamed protein product [Zymoseptoria tritici ST99CH_1A5]|uniref:Prolyl 4-hydroxylase alpha subunit domain-containing protein n=3 Tax=Zymoseptoria tritici TaxID=1047171 RepID=F9WW93_ZYMTI|nr:uncharacterized protein MYCGRDRAFT_83529 [Zymoseptoria tritici IPO323]EGP91052.1 hypothetical protein MYCGRDRAFT_83529 [Zymoseptoria tritici IPO323]SMQ45414.1 unnamed protein product [Zymoseptoria tritici ST99CH_3D7]SMY19120.1 unnamed protein product [Zymoseptoria tritici ST99CH_1A5]
MAPKVKTSKPGLATAKQPTPNWPAMQPLLPSSDLSFEILLQNQILTIPRLWTSTLAKKYVTFLSTLPLVTTPGKPKRGDAVRVNDRYQIDDAIFAEQLWSCTALKDLVLNAENAEDGTPLSEAAKHELWGGEVLGLNSNIRIYRYSKGQFFDQHYDDANNVMFPSEASPQSIKGRTTWTLLLYLSSPATGCIGGETIFYPEPASKREAAPSPVIAELEVGTALLHRHGKDCMLHEGREVTAGEKWVIRSDLVVKR